MIDGLKAEILSHDAQLGWVFLDIKTPHGRVFIGAGAFIRLQTDCFSLA